MAIETLTLRDPQSAATAQIAAGYGFNCFDFQVPRQGRPIPILWSATDFSAGTARPSGSGIPLLFPFPGRLHGTTFRWQDREYTLAAGDGRGNAIHGFVLNRPWRVVAQEPHRATGEFHASRDDAAILEQWPADFRIRVDYELHAERLSCQITVDNPDTRPLPCGLGTHPYFRVPLGGPSANACIVRLPVSQQWELRDMVTTGNLVLVENAAALQKGAPFEKLQFDNVFSGLVAQEKRIRSSIHDPASGVTVEQSFDAGFRECVVYTPAHREAICVEPYTCAPGFFELHRRGIDCGLRVLAPGQSFSLRVDIQVT
jgi:aldose 1-epimerase